MNTDKVAKYIQLDALKKSLESQVEDIKRQMSALNDELIAEFAEAGLQSLKVNGKTAYLRRDIYAALQSQDALKVISELDGWSWLIKEHIPHQTLSAHIRELERDPDTDMPILPPVLEGHVKVSEVFNIRVRRG